MKLKFAVALLLVVLVFGGVQGLRSLQLERTPSLPEKSEQGTPPPPLESDPIETPPEEPPVYRNHKEEGRIFELPLKGASGYAGLSLPLYEEAHSSSTRQHTLTAGDGFTILEEEGDFWKVSLGDVEGWVLHENCLINLPDILPSIVYDNPYASVCTSRSLGKEIPNVTGEQLYQARDFNERLGVEEYIVPTLYATAQKLSEIQTRARAEGNSLLIYESYRPYTAQQQLLDGLRDLIDQDAEVRRALSTPPWSLGWFVSTGISSHQKGKSVDLTLVEVLGVDTNTTGDYQYEVVTEYQEYPMPTQFDELSPRAAAFAYPAKGSAWNSVPPAETMTEKALLLQGYCVEAGLLPLASEWWHFSLSTSQGNALRGEFTISQTYSRPPVSENL